jgi:type I restriction enzyme S subunit
MQVKPGFKPSEVGGIPTNWLTRPCSAISELITVGIVVRPTQYYAAQGVPALRSANIREDGIDDQDLVFISEKANALLSKSQVRTGDVLTVRTGYPGTSAVVPPRFAGSNCIDILITRPSKAANPYYLSAWINSSLGKHQVLRNQGGLAQQHFNVGDLRNLIVALPPTLAEQEAIAEALNDADALIKALEQLLAKKRQLKQGAMQELLTGKKRLPSFNGAWDVMPFGKIAQPRKDRIDSRRTGSHEFCVELEHIEQGTGMLVGYTATSEGSSLKSVFQRNDVLFGKLRAYLRKYWLADRRGVCSTEIWVLTAKTGLLLPEFLFQLVTVDQFIEAASSAYGTHMPRSDWNVVKNYDVRLPPIPEQAAIATVLSDMDTEIAALDAKRNKVHALKRGMMQELLTGRIRLV